LPRSRQADAEQGGSSSHQPPASPARQASQRQGDEGTRQGRGGKKRTDHQRGSIAHTAEQLGKGKGKGKG
jgi:hypothetical protein